MASFRIDFGKPLLQIRELIKDLWYRNRHEQKMAAIELAERQLQFAKTKSWFELHDSLPNCVLQTKKLDSQYVRGISVEHTTAVEPRPTNIVTIEPEGSEDTAPSNSVPKKRVRKLPR